LLLQLNAGDGGLVPLLLVVVVWAKKLAVDAGCWRFRFRLFFGVARPGFGGGGECSFVLVLFLKDRSKLGSAHPASALVIITVG
jgi:hypothetical protein